MSLGKAEVAGGSQFKGAHGLLDRAFGTRSGPVLLGKGWVVVGSLNGGEVSAKLDREMALKVASDEAYSYLADVFWYDWDVTP